MDTTSETALASLPDKDSIRESASEVNPYEGGKFWERREVQHAGGEKLV